MKRPVIWGIRNSKWPLLVIGLIILLGLGGLAWWGRHVWLPQPLTLPAGQEFHAKISLDLAGPFQIGDLIPVTLAAQAVNGVTYALPDLATAHLDKLEIKTKTEPQNLRYRGGFGKKLHYTLTGWETGHFTIPALSMQYRNKAGQTKQYLIPASKLVIVSVLPKGRSKAQLLALKPKGVQPPVALPPSYRPLWYLAALGVGLAVIALLIFIWRKFRSTSAKTKAETVVIQEPAHVIAMRRLTALKTRDWLSQGNFKAYYSELSECLREYLENRFQINALEMTTEEFLSYLSGDQQLPTASRKTLQNLLKASDLIKFAKHLPEPAEADAAWDQVYQIVDTTKPEPPEPVPVSGQR
jgi:hypothetical protein